MIAESFERIHRSNLIGMGVVPLQFQPGQNAQSLGLTGREVFEITGLEQRRCEGGDRDGDAAEGGKPITFKARVRIDTPKEREYYRHGGILQYVLRQLAGLRPREPDGSAWRRVRAFGATRCVWPYSIWTGRSRRHDTLAALRARIP